MEKNKSDIHVDSGQTITGVEILLPMFHTSLTSAERAVNITSLLRLEKFFLCMFSCLL